MGLVAERGELVLERGEGIWVWDEEGRRYLDAAAGLWYCHAGYGRGEIADAAADQMRSLHAYSAYTDFAARTTLDATDRIAACRRSRMPSSSSPAAGRSRSSRRRSSPAASSA